MSVYKCVCVYMKKKEKTLYTINFSPVLSLNPYEKHVIVGSFGSKKYPCIYIRGRDILLRHRCTDMKS